MSQRGSSVEGAGRRGGQRGHVPYRGDDLERGKKTGKAVQQVARDSDEFEPFDQVLGQADRITPKGKPRRKSAGRQRLAPVPEQEDFTADMEVDEDEDEDESDAETPSQRRKTFRGLSAPASDPRLGSRYNTLSRRADVDFDAIPSPTSRSKSNHTRRDSSLSRLSRIGLEAPSATSSHVRIESNADGDLFDGSAQMSFTEMDRDDDVDDHDKENSPLIFPRHSSLDRVQHAEDFDQPVDEDEIPPAESNAKEGNAEDEDDEESFDHSQRSESIQLGVQQKGKGNSQSKSKKEPQPKKTSQKKPTTKKGLKERRTNLQGMESDDDASGLRRSKRVRYEPLDWWRCEKVVYGRRASGGRHVVPVITEIVRIPKEEHLPLSRKKSSRKPRSRKREPKTDQDEDDDDPEVDWDAETSSHGVVLDFPTNDEVERRVAFTSRMLDLRPAGDGSFSYQKIFADHEFIAAGQLLVPPGSSKPGKSTKDNTYIFWVIQGTVRVRIHESDYVFAAGGMFMVPRGNVYHVQNIGKRDSKLFFTQARMIPADELSETRANSEVESHAA